MKKKQNFFQDKGFYLALYSCVVAIAIIAGIATYANLNSMNRPAQKKIIAVKESDDVQPVLNNRSKSYLAPEDRNEPEKDTTMPKTKKESTKKIDSENFSAPKNSPAPVRNLESPAKSEPPVKNESREQSFNSFDENQKMSWPVFGEIIMDYDDENLVYDKTLEQYRTNECISLSARVGEQVKASADGIVKLITKTNEGGNTIVIDHGNDWLTTYSQLQDDLLVTEGERVKQGQVIGGVNSPTKYGILLGSHLDFKITHEDKSINPKSIMAAR